MQNSEQISNNTNTNVGIFPHESTLFHEVEEYVDLYIRVDRQTLGETVSELRSLYSDETFASPQEENMALYGEGYLRGFLFGSIEAGATLLYNLAANGEEAACRAVVKLMTPEQASIAAAKLREVGKTVCWEE